MGNLLTRIATPTTQHLLLRAQIFDLFLVESSEPEKFMVNKEFFTQFITIKISGQFLIFGTSLLPQRQNF